MQHLMRPMLVALCVIAMTGLAPLNLQAQDRQDEHRDENRDQRPDEHRDENRAPQQRAPQQDEHRAKDRDSQGADPDRYRHDHPNASARCHDGFFTTTRDRDRACRRHGGIDVWLVL